MPMLYVVHRGEKLDTLTPVYAVHTELAAAQQIKSNIREAKITEIDLTQFLQKDTQHGPQNF